MARYLSPYLIRYLHELYLVLVQAARPTAGQAHSIYRSSEIENETLTLLHVDVDT